MSKPLIELITCEAGDWEVLRVKDGETLVDNHIIPNYKIDYEGHSIPVYMWIKLLKELGYKVVEKEISDEDMEMGKY